MATGCFADMRIIMLQKTSTRLTQLVIFKPVYFVDKFVFAFLLSISQKCTCTLTVKTRRVLFFVKFRSSSTCITCTRIPVMFSPYFVDLPFPF